MLLIPSAVFDGETVGELREKYLIRARAILI
jgi:hypothetical protein